MKDLKYYKKYYREKFPNTSEKEITRLAEAALARDAQNVSPDDSFTSFSETQLESAAGKRGVLVGFGLTDKDGNDLYLMPGIFPQYMTTLSVRNPKAYNMILQNVYRATGTKFRDPNTLGTWLEGVSRNLLASSRLDPTAANISMEALVNANIVNRGTAGLFGTGGEPNIPTRQIYNIPTADIAAKIDKDAQSILGRAITDDDKSQDWYINLTNTLNDMYNRGIVTKTKVVKNPKTGKKERQVIQTPGFSEEKMSEIRATALEEADPLGFERKQNLDFANWAMQKMGGRG